MTTAIWNQSLQLGRAMFVAALLTCVRWKAAHSFRPVVGFHEAIARQRLLSLRTNLAENDIDWMNVALHHARKGLGQTFPNPAVGCVLVRRDTNEMIGSGFHPRAGFPHAEVFALLQATGHLSDGSKAAESVVLAYSRKPKDAFDPNTFELVKQLTEQYTSADGPLNLFSGRNFQDFPVTAYVTLEPCCHYGKTPPCAVSLVQANVSRVVVGYGDPNPRVDGGGVKLMQEAGIQVVKMSDSDNEEAKRVHEECAEIVSDFVKRIAPRQSMDLSEITGAMRRALRSHSERMKKENSLTEVDWEGQSSLIEDGDIETDWESVVQNLSIDPSWLERLDHLLWEHEILLVRLNKAAKKKKVVKLLGTRIASQLKAHVAQTLGHTVLLYRPGIPPLLNLTSSLCMTHEQDKV